MQNSTWSSVIPWRHEHLFKFQVKSTLIKLPSRELTYPTLGKGNTSTQKWLATGYVSFQERTYLYIYMRIYIYIIHQSSSTLDFLGDFQSSLHGFMLVECKFWDFQTSIALKVASDDTRCKFKRFLSCKGKPRKREWNMSSCCYTYFKQLFQYMDLYTYSYIVYIHIYIS